MGEKKRLQQETLEEQVAEMKRKLAPLMELCIPPREVREEIKRNLLTAQVSLLKVFKTLLEYQIEALERLADGEDKTEKREKGSIKKIKVD